MALPQGINFRQTLGYVTDGANDYYSTGSLAYPTTSTQGNNVGWEQPTNTQADINNGVDPRLAGIVYSNDTSNNFNFRIDLPATGSYSARLAMGRSDGATNNTGPCKLYDNNSLLTTLTIEQAETANHFRDATDADRTSASDWVTNNAVNTQTFSSTICRFRFGPETSGFWIVAHCYIEAAAAGGTNINAVTGVETWNGRTATLGLSTNVRTAIGTETWNGRTATITTGNGVAATTGVETWNGRQANINSAINITTTTGVETWNGRTAGIGISINVGGTIGTETWNGRTATVNVSGPTSITIGLSTEFWNGYAATVTPGGGAGVRRNRVFGSKKHVTYKPN